MRYTRDRWIAVLLFGIGLLTTAAGPVQAHGGWGHRTERRFQERLGLSDDQMKAIREIHERQAPTVRQLGQQLRQARQELRRLTLTGADDSAMAAKAGEVKNLVAQMIDLRVTTLREIAGVLTPEQRQKLASLKLGWHDRHHWRHHHRHHHEEGS